MERRSGYPKTEAERMATHEGEYGEKVLPRRGTGLGVVSNPKPILVNANRDLPYHDYETATLTATYVRYNVGENNQLGRGTQAKLFESKSTLIMSTVAADVKFNSTENVEIDILANTYYEFKSNIHTIFYKYSASEGTIYIWTEGVKPIEARRPE